MTSVSSKIVGGSVARHGQFPWQVSSENGSLIFCNKNVSHLKSLLSLLRQHEDSHGQHLNKKEF